MVHVDALSRNPPIQTAKVCVAIMADDDWLLAVQEADPALRSTKLILSSGSREEHKELFMNYELRRSKIYRKTAYGSRAVIPKGARWQILRMNHDDIGHFALDKTYELIASKFWFPHMRRFIKKYVRACINCMFHKKPGGKKPGYLYPVERPPRPFHTIHVDHIGPFIRSKRGNTQVLVAVDGFTKFAFVYAVKSTKSKYVVEKLKEIIKVFGVPKRVISDRGKAFDCKEFKDFCAEHNIKHHMTAVGMPRGNGQVERCNATVLNVLATMGDDKDWDLNMMKIQIGLNGTLNKTLGVSPSEVMLGYRIGLYNEMDSEGNEVDVTSLRKAIFARIQKAQAQQKQYFDQNRGQAVTFSPGDMVLVQISSIISTGTSRKLVPK